MLTLDEIRDIGLRLAREKFGPSVRDVQSIDFASSMGEGSVLVRIRFSDQGSERLTEDAPLDFLIGLRDELSRQNDDRSLLIEYEEEGDRIEDDDPDDLAPEQEEREAG